MQFLVTARGALSRERYQNGIARMTTQGQVTEFTSLFSSAQPWGITTGSDGNIWFSEAGNQRVGRITPQGTVTEFPATTMWVRDLCPGPDGEIWIAIAGNGHLGHMSTTGVASQVTYVNGQYCTTGPDGNMWYSVLSSNQIARIASYSKFPSPYFGSNSILTLFSTPTLASNPGGITAGSDGNLWFTETAVNQIARSTINGVITEVSVGRTPSCWI